MSSVKGHNFPLNHPGLLSPQLHGQYNKVLSSVQWGERSIHGGKMLSLFQACVSVGYCGFGKSGGKVAWICQSKPIVDGYVVSPLCQR